MWTPIQMSRFPEFVSPRDRLYQPLYFSPSSELFLPSVSLRFLPSSCCFPRLIFCCSLSFKYHSSGACDRFDGRGSL